MADGALKRTKLLENYGDQIKIITGTAGGTTSLKPQETTVLVIPPGSSTHTVYLPPVGLALPGVIYTVESHGNDSGAITVASLDDDDPQYTSGSLTADHDYVCLVCNGKRWYELAELTT